MHVQQASPARFFRAETQHTALPPVTAAAASTTAVGTIVNDAMEGPVFAADSHKCESDAIKMWLQKHDTSSVDGSRMPHKHINPASKP